MGERLVFPAVFAKEWERAGADAGAVDFYTCKIIMNIAISPCWLPIQI